jgi:hypothetical protein
VQQQTLPAINKLGDADTSLPVHTASSNVWKTLLNAIRAKALAKPASKRAKVTAGARATAGGPQGG